MVRVRPGSCSSSRTASVSVAHSVPDSSRELFIVGLVLLISYLIPEKVYKAVIPPQLSEKIVWLSDPGPGGGGGGGNKMPDPPKPAEIVKPKPAPTPVPTPSHRLNHHRLNRSRFRSRRSMRQ